MPSVYLVACGEEEAKNFKQFKHRVALLKCANTSRMCKLPLAFIHKYKKPALPVHYYKYTKAWMDVNMFESWFHNKFIPYVKKHYKDNNGVYKVLLLIGNAPAHPSEETLKSKDRKAVMMFLSPNTTFVMQPMDQDIIGWDERHYKKLLLCHLILED